MRGRRWSAERDTQAHYTSDEGASSVGGTYPGGPRKRRPDRGLGERQTSPDLRTAEEMEARSHDHHRRYVQKRRRKRILIGFLVAVVLAGGVGFWMGVQAHRTAEEIASEQSAGGRSGNTDLIKQRNIILQQLWEMEDLELAPRHDN